MADWQPIETAPLKEDNLILLVNGIPRAPCMWSKAGECSEDGFWLWWQAEPEFLIEVIGPTHWMRP